MKKTAPQFGSDYDIDDEDAVLRCPNCGGESLHHLDINTYYREWEDSNKGVHVFIHDGTVHVDGDITENPSKRRDGLSIDFLCETCDAAIKLHLVQHKGLTLLSFEHEVPGERE